MSLDRSLSSWRCFLKRPCQTCSCVHKKALKFCACVVEKTRWAALLHMALLSHRNCLASHHAFERLEPQNAGRDDRLRFRFRPCRPWSARDGTPQRNGASAVAVMNCTVFSEKPNDLSTCCCSSCKKMKASEYTWPTSGKRKQNLAALNAKNFALKCHESSTFGRGQRASLFSRASRLHNVGLSAGRPLCITLVIKL